MLAAIDVSDMHCSNCAARIETALRAVPGVDALFVNPARRQVLVEHAPDIDPYLFLTALRAIGFHPSLPSTGDHSKPQRESLMRIGIAGVAMLQTMIGMLLLHSGAMNGIEGADAQLLAYVSLAFTIPVVTYAAVPFYLSAWRSVSKRPRLPGMDVPVALAILGAFVLSVWNTGKGHGDVYYDSVTMFAFLLLAARHLDTRLKARFDLSSALLAALPDTALVETGTDRVATPLDAVPIGTRVWVPAGAQVPLDGHVVSDVAELDESALSGESAAVKRAAGSAIHAGALNVGPGFAMTTSAPREKSRMASIAALADRAAAERPQAAQIADSIARVFVPGVLLLAALSGAVWSLVDPARAVEAVLGVLVVSCPCALSLATPATFTAAMTRLRQAGIVLTRSTVLETVPTLDRAILDKTGTLTVHEPKLQSVEVTDADWIDRETALDIAAALEQYATHPIARAFPKPRQAQVEQVGLHTGAGITGTWRGQPVRLGTPAFCGAAASTDTATMRGVLLSVNGRIAAQFTIDDPVRPDAAAAMRALRAHRVEPLMASGDTRARCAPLAAALGIDFLSEQSPESKLALVEKLQAEGHRVLMLGDGINDIPALAAADVSATVLESSDLVRSHSDVLLLNRRLDCLPLLFDIARRARRILRQNLAWSLLYNLVCIPLAALGLINPALAALGMTASSTLVLLNASRLLQSSHYPQRFDRTARGVVRPSAL